MEAGADRQPATGGEQADDRLLAVKQPIGRAERQQGDEDDGAEVTPGRSPAPATDS